jgi:hypothetical protein
VQDETLVGLPIVVAPNLGTKGALFATIASDRSVLENNGSSAENLAITLNKDGVSVNRRSHDGPKLPEFLEADDALFHRTKVTSRAQPAR